MKTFKRVIFFCCILFLQSSWMAVLAKSPVVHHPSVMENIMGFITISLIVLLCIAVVIVQIWVYFVPYFIARKIESPNKKAFFWWNLSLGWTGIVWIILAWLALRTEFPNVGYQIDKQS